VRSKEFLFDPTRRMGMLRVVVAEGHLVQHFWIRIAGGSKSWRVFPAAGTGFAPSEGVRAALKMVAEAIQPGATA